MFDFYWLVNWRIWPVRLQMFVVGQIKSDNLNLKQPIKPEIKGKDPFYLTSVVPSVLQLRETAINGSRRCALYPPLPLSVLRFTGIQSYSYTDQRKVEADVEVTEDRTGDLSLRKPRTSQLSHDCSRLFTTNHIRAFCY